MSDYKEIEYNSGDIIYDSEKPTDIAWFILEGTIDLAVTLGTKANSIKLSDNQFIGDISIAVKEKSKRDDLSYSALAKAITKVKVVEIPIKDIETELEMCPPLLKAWFASFINRMMITIEELSQ